MISNKLLFPTYLYLFSRLLSGVNYIYLDSGFWIPDQIPDFGFLFLLSCSGLQFPILFPVSAFRVLGQPKKTEAVHLLLFFVSNFQAVLKSLKMFLFVCMNLKFT